MKSPRREEGKPLLWSGKKWEEHGDVSMESGQCDGADRAFNTSEHNSMNLSLPIFARAVLVRAHSHHHPASL